MLAGPHPVSLDAAGGSFSAAGVWGGPCGLALPHAHGAHGSKDTCFLGVRAVLLFVPKDSVM